MNKLKDLASSSMTSYERRAGRLIPHQFNKEDLKNKPYPDSTLVMAGRSQVENLNNYCFSQQNFQDQKVFRDDLMSP